MGYILITGLISVGVELYLYWSLKTLKQNFRWEYEEFNVKCICNPLGYHKESGNGQWTKIKQIEV